MVPFVRRLSVCEECLVHVYSNAGLPNDMGGYDDTPADMAKYNETFFENNWLNMVGGCCGSTPAHIAAIKGLLKEKGFKPRPLPAARRPKMWLSGLMSTPLMFPGLKLPLHRQSMHKRRSSRRMSGTKFRIR